MTKPYGDRWKREWEETKENDEARVRVLMFHNNCHGVGVVIVSMRIWKSKDVLSGGGSLGQEVKLFNKLLEGNHATCIRAVIGIVDNIDIQEWVKKKAEGEEHALTAEQAQVLSLLSIGDMGDEIASALPVYAEFPILLSFGYVYVMDDSIDTDFEITDTGRAALKRYNVGRGKVE